MSADAYRDNVGREHRNLPEDHPDRWQWEYRGSKSERDALRQELGLVDQEDEAPVIIEGQEEMFA